MEIILPNEMFVSAPMQDQADVFDDETALLKRNNRMFAIAIALAFCAASSMAAFLSFL